MNITEIINAASGFGGILASVISALVYRNQRLTDQRWERTQAQVDEQNKELVKQGREIIAISGKLSSCKVDCTQTFVNNEQFVREAGFTRRALESVASSLARVEGKLQVADRMPEIAGQIAANVVKELKTSNQ